jgi:pimeloyl-ACP methyl ester carboxylesterase
MGGVNEKAQAAVAVVVLCFSGCSPGPRPRSAPERPTREWSATVLLHGRPFEIHLSAPESPAIDQVVVLYASGDGGWLGAAVDMFHQIAKAGYYTIGFSSRAFLKIERPGATLTTTTQLAAEYAQLLSRARTILGLDPSSRAILTGWSRGAAFAVLAASEPAARSGVLGVIAIGMSDHEDLAINGPQDESDDGSASPTANRGAFDTYASIARLALPCAVIQASRDNYLPAARARQLFGPDTPLRRFYPVDARNHRFSGGKPAFNAALLDAMHWLITQPMGDPAR